MAIPFATHQVWIVDAPLVTDTHNNRSRSARDWGNATVVAGPIPASVQDAATLGTSLATTERRHGGRELLEESKMVRLNPEVPVEATHGIRVGSLTGPLYQVKGEPQHMPDPLATLQAAHRMLADGGKLLVQVPDLATSPFDLIVADHRMHFTAATLGHLAARAGLRAGPRAAKPRAGPCGEEDDRQDQHREREEVAEVSGEGERAEQEAVARRANARAPHPEPQSEEEERQARLARAMQFHCAKQRPCLRESSGARRLSDSRQAS